MEALIILLVVVVGIAYFSRRTSAGKRITRRLTDAVGVTKPK